MDPLLSDASDPRLVTMAVKLAQLYLTAMPHGTEKKVGHYHCACYEIFPRLELERVPKMIFESVTRDEFFSACEEKGFLTLAQSFEAEFSQQLHALPYATTRWFQHSTPS
jgi:hypothetical protein